MMFPLAFAWLRPRRRLVMWLVVIVVAASGASQLLGRGVLRPPHDWGSVTEGVQVAAVLFFIAWRIHRTPRHGFWVGVLGLGLFVFLVGIAAVIWWSIQLHPEKMEKWPEFREMVSGWGGPVFWLTLMAKLSAYLLFSGAALSLRWLYPKPKPGQVRQEVKAILAAANRVDS